MSTRSENRTMFRNHHGPSRLLDFCGAVSHPLQRHQSSTPCLRSPPELQTGTVQWHHTSEPPCTLTLFVSYCTKDVIHYHHPCSVTVKSGWSESHFSDDETVTYLKS